MSRRRGLTTLLVPRQHGLCTGNGCRSATETGRDLEQVVKLCRGTFHLQGADNAEQDDPRSTFGTRLVSHLSRPAAEHLAHQVAGRGVSHRARGRSLRHHRRTHWRCPASGMWFGSTDSPARAKPGPWICHPGELNRTHAGKGLVRSDQVVPDPPGVELPLHSQSGSGLPRTSPDFAGWWSRAPDT